MALIKCPECGYEVSENAENCPKCGYRIERKKYCKYCGEKIPNDSVVCPKCGRQIESVAHRDSGIIINNSSSASSSASASNHVEPDHTKKKMINKKTALILCIFLGWLGAHKFYEGKTGMGILYVLTMGLFGIGWIIDIIIILGKTDPYYV